MILLMIGDRQSLLDNSDKPLQQSGKVGSESTIPQKDPRPYTVRAEADP